jgi:uncharacterized protein (TIGR03000 family)
MTAKSTWGGAIAALVLGGLSLVQAQTGDYGTIVVKVRPDASISIGGAPTTQKGAVRTFYTPPLPAGYKYQYELTVTWKDGAEEKRASKLVDVAAGKTSNVDFGGGEIKKVDDKKKDDTTKVDVTKKGDAKKIDDKTKEPIKTGGEKVRSFDFLYSGVVKDLKPGQEVSVWLPYPQSTEAQDVKQIDQEIPGGTPPMLGQEKLYGNKMLFFKAKANDKGEVPFRVEYRVTRREVNTGGKATLKPKESMDLIDRFLQPDKLVPISGKPLDLLKDKKLPGDEFARAKVFYDVVNGHMKYDKPAGKPWGRGDAEWACDSKFGNCTDFHSIFISMARGHKIPAKFEMGFSVPEKRGAGDIGGYHCWAWFMPGGKGWAPVDISEANRHPEMTEYYFGNLTEDRVQFTTGRDINLSPPQKGPALNFFVYPYVEVDGAPYPNEKIARKFAYQDVK